MTSSETTRTTTRTTTFTSHTADTAPAAARPVLAGTIGKFGFLPDPVAKLAESPELLGAFLRAVAVFDQTTLTALEREVVVMTMATHTECHYCVALHSATLVRQAAPEGVVEHLRAREPLDDPRLAALQRFALRVIATSGGVPADELDAFLAAGYTRRNALEVVLGIGAYTMSTFANRLTGAELDPSLEAHRWAG